MHDRRECRGGPLPAEHVPAPYRVHERPPESKYEDLLEFLKEFQLSLPAWSKVRPGDYTKLLKKVRARPDAALLESVLRSQSLAVYSPENNGHFGLALEAYAHFTSPIRRYPDLLVHRALKHALTGASPENSSTPRVRWRRCRCSAPNAAGVPTKPSAKWTSAIAPRGWKSMWVASSTA